MRSSVERKRRAFGSYQTEPVVDRDHAVRSPRTLKARLAIVSLGAALGIAVVRPWGISEAVVAVPVALGILPVDVAGKEACSLGPTIGFLAGVLVLAGTAEREGLFAAAGSWMAAVSRGRPVALLGNVSGYARS